MAKYFTVKINRIYLVVVTSFSTIGCDQVTKMVAEGTLENSSPLSYFGGVFRLQYAENPGAFLSLGATLPENLRFGFSHLSAESLWPRLPNILIKNQYGFWTTFALSLILGGGIGNLLDRTLRSERAVIDFLNIGFGQFRTGIFNVADIAITAGGFILLLEALSNDLNI